MKCRRNTCADTKMKAFMRWRFTWDFVSVLENSAGSAFSTVSCSSVVFRGRAAEMASFHKEGTEEQEAEALLKVNTNLRHKEHLIFQLLCLMLLF